MPSLGPARTYIPGMAESKRHHFVPQSILRRFSPPGSPEKIWIYDKQSGETFTSSILQTGMEKGFNVVVINGKRINFEGDFNDVDGAMADVHRRLVETRNLTGLSAKDRLTLADATAVQLLRTKMVRTTLKSVTTALIEDMSRVGLVTGELPSLDEQQARAIARNAFHDRAAHRESLSRLDLLLIRPETGQPLWISDNPIVRYNQQPYGETGLTSPGVEIYWPIAPDLAIAFMCPSFRRRVAGGAALGDKLEEPTRGQCAELHRGFTQRVPVPLGRSGGTAAFLNRLQVHYSSRFIYGRDNDFSLAKADTDANPKLKSVASMISVGRIGEGPAKRLNMPAGLQMVVYGRTDHQMVALDSYEESGWGFDAKPVEAIFAKILMADLPWREVRIFEDGREMRGMREVKVAVEDEDHGPLLKVQPIHDLPFDTKP